MPFFRSHDRAHPGQDTPTHGRSWRLLSLLAAMALAGCGGGGAPHLSAEDGVFDLREAPLDRTIPLSGEWKVLAGQDNPRFSTFDFDDASWDTVHLPSRFSAQGLPAEGMAWYRLHLRLPPGITFKGFLPYAGHAYTLYAAGSDGRTVVIAEGGHPALTGNDVVNSRAQATFTLPSDTSLTLAWKIANFGYQHGGPFYALEVGPAEVVDARILWGTSIDVAIFFLYVVLAFFFVVNWLWRRSDLPSLAVGLLAFVMAVRTAVLSGRLEGFFPGFFDFEMRIAVEALSFFGLFGLLIFLIWTFFPLEFAPLRIGSVRLSPPSEPDAVGDGAALKPLLPRWLRRVNTLAAAVAIGVTSVLAVATLMASPWVISHLLAGMRWFVLAIAPFGMLAVLLAAERRRPMAAGMLAGFGLLITVGIHDVLFSMNLVPGPHYLMSYAFLGFLLLQGFAIARRNAENAKALRVAHQTAIAASEGKSRFISAVSHEMRTPLTSIMGFTHILHQEGAHTLEPHHLEFVASIRQSADRMLALVNDLLDLTRAESGRLQMHLTTVSVTQIVDDVLREMQTIAEDKGLVLRVQATETDFHVHADELRLRQVLTNLVSNAVKFTEEGSVTLSVVAARLEGRDACAISVTDTGIGIAPEFMPRLFEPFAQENRGYGLGQTGAGLGLALSRDLVRRMNGELIVESKVNAGSRFTIVMPQAEPPPPPPAAPHTHVPFRLSTGETP